MRTIRRIRKWWRGIVPEGKIAIGLMALVGIGGGLIVYSETTGYGPYARDNYITDCAKRTAQETCRRQWERLSNVDRRLWR